MKFFILLPLETLSVNFGTARNALAYLRDYTGYNLN